MVEKLGRACEPLAIVYLSTFAWQIVTRSPDKDIRQDNRPYVYSGWIKNHLVNPVILSNF